MYVRNKGKKILGFGLMELLPGEADKLPEGYDANHPVVAYFISKGWLAEEAEPKVKPDAKTDADAKAGAETKTDAETKSK